MANVYTFTLALQTEDELKRTIESFDVDGNAVLPSEPGSAPTFKTLQTIAETEEEAIAKMDAYVSVTSFKDIEDNKVV